MGDPDAMAEGQKERKMKESEASLTSLEEQLGVVPSKERLKKCLCLNASVTQVQLALNAESNLVDFFAEGKRLTVGPNLLQVVRW